MTWSTDGFYRETPDKISYRIEEGCSVVEMECSALAQLLNFEELFGDYYSLRQIPLQILTITINEIGAQRLLIRL